MDDLGYNYRNTAGVKYHVSRPGSNSQLHNLQEVDKKELAEEVKF